MTEKLPYGTKLPDDSTAAEASAVPSEERSLAIVTGGARGIGRYLSEAFAHAGYHVVITATSADRAEAAAAEIIGSTGGAVTGFGLTADDAASVAELRDSVRGLESETGRRLQVLVNNAGRIGTPPRVRCGRPSRRASRAWSTPTSSASPSWSTPLPLCSSQAPRRPVVPAASSTSTRDPVPRALLPMPCIRRRRRPCSVSPTPSSTSAMIWVCGSSRWHRE